MKHLMVITILLLLVGTVGMARAQLGGGYDLTWNTGDGGGATFVTGGDYWLGGTIGQLDAGMLASSNGGYTLSGGFWPGARIPAPPEYRIYLPLVLR